MISIEITKSGLGPRLGLGALGWTILYLGESELDRKPKVVLYGRDRKRNKEEKNGRKKKGS